LLNFINEGPNREKGMHKMKESYDSLTHWAQIKLGAHVVVPILREKSDLHGKKVAKLLSQFQGEAADPSELDFKLKYTPVKKLPQ
jgi:hypothetical protein